MTSKLRLTLVVLFATVQLCVPSILPSQPSTEENELKIVCHLLLMTFYQPNYREYLPEIIDESQCTHVVYRERMSYRNSTINPYLNEGKEMFHQRAVEMKKKGIPVSISIFKYNLNEQIRTLKSAEERDLFVNSVVALIEKFQFSGFDLSWFSRCRGCSEDENGKAYEDAIDLVRRMSEVFKPRGWLLSAIVSINKTEIDNGFDISKLSEYVDWLTVWPPYAEKDVTYGAQLYPLADDTNDRSSANWTINYLIELGVPSRKIVMTFPSIGGSFTLASEQQNGINAPTSVTRSGVDKKDFYEICSEVKPPQWTVVHDAEKRVGSYAYHGTQWISYDDVEDVQRKAEYVLQMKLGGGAISSTNSDDFQNVCGCGKYPLLTAMSQVLRNATGPRITNCT